MKNKLILLILVLVGFQWSLLSQVKISDLNSSVANPSALLELESRTKGFLFPEINLADTNLIPSPANHLIVYDSSQNQLLFRNYLGENRTNWSTLGSFKRTLPNLFHTYSGNKMFSLRPTSLGNSASSTPAFFIGIQTGGNGFSRILDFGGSFSIGYKGSSGIRGDQYFQQFISIGREASLSNGSGLTSNMSIGNYSSQNIYQGGGNLIIGHEANRFGGNNDNLAYPYNIAIGYRTLYNSNGRNNTLIGNHILENESNGSQNIIVGHYGLYQHQRNDNNLGIGYEVLRNSISGAKNLALGYRAMYSLTSGFNNLALGYESLFGDGTSRYEIAIGNFTLGRLNQGQNSSFNHSNIAIGDSSLPNLLFGTKNIGIGANAGKNLSQGNGNIIIGNESEFLNSGGDNQLSFGKGGLIATNIYGASNENKTLSLGYFGSFASGAQTNFYVNGAVRTNTVAAGSSDIRLKKDIVTFQSKNQAILNLRPVSYEWKNTEYTQKDNLVHLGLIAQMVEKELPEAVKTAEDAIQTKSIHYDALIAALIEAIQAEYREYFKLKKEIDETN